MATVEDEIDALMRAEIYKSRDDIISDAFRALLALKPSLKIEIAVDLYRNEKVSLWKAAGVAGLTMEEFKELLVSRSIKIEIGDEKSKTRLAKAGLL
jgi:Uncharacterised protein family (UPF0175).